MQSINLPERPSLVQLRKQARDLQSAVRSGDTAAADFARTYHPDAPAPDLPLSGAQLVVARLYGFPSWPRLVAHLDVVARYQRVHAPDQGFLALACLTFTDDDGPHRWTAACTLPVPPGIHGAAARADVAEVRRLLAGDPGLAHAEGGPQRWAPLMHLAYSRLDQDVAEADVLDCVRLLLRHGADPDTGYLFEGLPTPFTVLTGAFGGGERDQPAHPHALALAGLLLDAGADPNDGQALYNRMFSPDDTHLRMLLAHGLGTGDGGPWRARLPDVTDPPAVMLRGQLDWALAHGFHDRIRLLAEHGVDLASPLGDGRTPTERATISGRTGTVALLVSLGAPAPAPGPVDALVGAVLAADRAGVDRIRRDHPEALGTVLAAHPGLVVRAAAAGSVDAVRLLVTLGFSVDALARADLPIDQPWETALHHAAGNGDLAMVRVLLSLGADPEIPDARFDGTALGWARHYGQDAVIELLS